MSATDFLRHCKYKKNLAYDVQCELYFLQLNLQLIEIGA